MQKVFRLRKRKRLIEDIDTMCQQRREEYAMVQHGWRLWPANATGEERMQALENYLNGGKPEWYPPGYLELPIITEGKIKVRKE
jgi:hypothetical protein